MSRNCSASSSGIPYSSSATSGVPRDRHSTPRDIAGVVARRPPKTCEDLALDTVQRTQPHREGIARNIADEAADVRDELLPKPDARESEGESVRRARERPPGHGPGRETFHARAGPYPCRKISREHIALGRAGRELRVRRGLSQEHFGFRADLHRNYVGVIECGEINPTFRVLLKLERGLQRPLSEVVGCYEREAQE